MRCTSVSMPVIDKGKLKQLVVATIANLTAIHFGIIQGWSSPSLPLLRSGDKASNKPLTLEEETWLGSIVNLTALFASPFYGYILQSLGRKMTGYITGAGLVVGWCLIIFSNSLICLYVARIILGLMLPGIVTFCVTYVGEISEDSIRGILGATRGVSIGFGILFIYSIGPFLSISNMGIICVCISVLFLFLFYWLPESPMYLFMKGKNEETFEAYFWLRGGDKEITAEEMKKLSAIVQDNKEEMSLRDTLSIRGTRKALLIAFVFPAVLRLSGLGVIVSYCQRFFEMSGSSISPEFSSIIVSTLDLSGCILALVVADVIGRRPILLGGLIIQFTSLFLFGIYMYLKDLNMVSDNLLVFPIVLLSFYSFCCIGVLEVFLIVLAEIIRPEARGLGMTIFSITIWALGFVTTKYYQNLESLVELHGSFWFYAAVSLFGVVFTYFMIPETKNRSLESIFKELNGEE